MLGKKSLFVFAVVAVVAVTSYYRYDSPLAQAQDEKHGELVKHRKDNLEAAKIAYLTWEKEIEWDRSSLSLYSLSLRWLNADLELATDKEGRIVAYEGHARRLKKWDEELNISRGPESRIRTAVRSFQREAEYWSVRERLESR